MDRDEFKQKVIKYNEVVIFGYSDIGRIIYSMIQGLKVEIVFCDNSAKKWNKDVPIPIIPVDKAVQVYPKALFIIASNLHGVSMFQQLLRLGIENVHILHELPDFILKEKEVIDKSVKMHPLEKLQFDVHIAEHCNLNCKGCSQFSPVIAEEYLDIKTYKNDIRRLSELFHGVSGRINILGGEPLLNPDIIDFLTITRENFPIGDIRVITNGILLEHMSESFWRVCSKYDIHVLVTKYPIKLDYEGIKKIAKRYKVYYEYFSNSDGGKYSYHLPLDLCGKQDIEYNFTHCAEANNCIMLRNGKIYPCTWPANIRYFNTFFHKNLEVCKEDSIDIYKAKSGEEILEFLSQPIPFCRYCDVMHRTFDDAWELSKKNIKEWIL